MSTHGTIFTTAADAQVLRWTQRERQDVAQRGVALVRANLRSVLRHPTGYYEAHIRTEGRLNASLVTDSNVIYGPWLEGVGERNRSTRFRGYSTFRRTRLQLEYQTQQRINADVQSLVKELNR